MWLDCATARILLHDDNMGGNNKDWDYENNYVTGDGDCNDGR